MEDSNDSIIKAIITISSDTLKNAFIHIGENKIELLNLNKRTVAEDIESRQGTGIIKEGQEKSPI